MTSSSPAATPGATARADLGDPFDTPFDAVLFDLDGTLVDSTAVVSRSWLRWAEAEQVDPQRLLGFHGVPAAAIVAALVEPSRVTAAVARIDQIELADTEGVVPLPGAVEALAALPAGRAAIATSCGLDLARVRIGAAGLDVPDVLVTADQVERGKPAPEPYLLAAERLGVDPTRCLVVEDAPSGLASARAAGCTTLAVATTTARDELEADLVVTDLSEVRLEAGPDGVHVRLARLAQMSERTTGHSADAAEARAVSEAPTAGHEIVVRHDVTVELVRAAAQDADVLFAARVSTKGESSLEDVDGDASRSTGLINYLMRDRHGSPFEHNSMTFYVQAPIFVFREFMRHRMASYNEESGRYRELRPVFYVPGPQRRLVQQGKPGAYEFVEGTSEQHTLVDTETRAVCEAAYASYQRMLEAGVAREVARIVLPLTIYSSMYVTVNARSLMNFLSLRTKRDDAHFPSYPQREIEMCAEQMETAWQRLMPLTHAAFEKNGRVAP